MNDEQNKTIAPEVKPRRITVKKQKPEYQEFSLELSRLLDGEEARKSIEGVYRHLKVGYSGEIVEEQISETMNRLLQWEPLSYLALKVGISLLSGKTSQLVRRLYRGMQLAIAKKSGYPFEQVPIELRTWNNVQREAVRDWVASNTAGGYVSPDWAREALVCLLKENPNHLEFQAIHTIIDRCVPVKQTKKRSSKAAKEAGPRKNKHSDYIRRVAQLFLARKFSTAKLQYALDFSSVFLENYESLERDFAAMSRDLQAKKDNILQLESKLDVTEARSFELTKEVNGLKEDIQKTRQELADEKQRYQLLERHWKEKLKSELSGLAHEMKKQFGHEVREARLSLQSKPADIAMALDRISHMEEYLQKLGEHNG